MTIYSNKRHVQTYTHTLTHTYARIFFRESRICSSPIETDRIVKKKRKYAIDKPFCESQFLF